MENKLISMTDFVLEQRMTSEEISTASFSQIQNHIATYYDKVFTYANFLKQPLTLGMFVPIGSDGVVLDEPQSYEWYIEDNEQYFNGDPDECIAYQKAQEKVLFKGFSYKYNIDKEGKKWEYVKNEFPHVFSFDQLQKNTVESLLTKFKEEYLIELTESALKQIGLKTN